MDVDEIDLDSSEAESLEGMATNPIGASEAPAAAARRHWLPDPGFPRVANLDEQARLFASDEETIIIAQVIALAKNVLSSCLSAQDEVFAVGAVLKWGKHIGSENQTKLCQDPSQRYESGRFCIQYF